MSRKMRQAASAWGGMNGIEVFTGGKWVWLSRARPLLNESGRFSSVIKVVADAIADETLRADDAGNVYYHTSGGDEHNKVSWS